MLIHTSNQKFAIIDFDEFVILYNHQDFLQNFQYKLKMLKNHQMLMKASKEKGRKEN